MYTKSLFLCVISAVENNDKLTCKFHEPSVMEEKWEKRESYVLKHIRAETAEPVTVFGYVIMNILGHNALWVRGQPPPSQNVRHTGRGEVALWPTAHTRPPPAIHCLPACILHPPSHPARPAPLLYLKTSWFSGDKTQNRVWVCLCVHMCLWTLGVNGLVFLTGTWIQCVAPDRQACSFTLFKLIFLPSGFEYRPLLRNIHADPHRLKDPQEFLGMTVLSTF